MVLSKYRCLCGRTAAFFLTLALLLGSLFLPVAMASNVSITPVQLNLGGRMRSQLITVGNNSDQATRFLVRATGWRMDEEGNIQFLDDDQLIIYPASFSLPGRSTQNIRVGTAVGPADSEKTWRVVLEELPDPDAVIANGSAVNVLSTITVPVFMPPVSVHRSMAMTVSRISGRTAGVTLTNEGNVHELMLAVALTAFKGAQALQKVQVEGWYLLPSHRRSLGLQGAGAWCSLGADRFEINVTTSASGAVASRTLDAGQVCP